MGDAFRYLDAAWTVEAHIGFQEDGVVEQVFLTMPTGDRAFDARLVRALWQCRLRAPAGRRAGVIRIYAPRRNRQ